MTNSEVQDVIDITRFRNMTSTADIQKEIQRQVYAIVKNASASDIQELTKAVRRTLGLLPASKVRKNSITEIDEYGDGDIDITDSATQSDLVSCHLEGELGMLIVPGPDESIAGMTAEEAWNAGYAAGKSILADNSNDAKGINFTAEGALDTSCFTGDDAEDNILSTTHE